MGEILKSWKSQRLSGNQAPSLVPAPNEKMHDPLPSREVDETGFLCGDSELMSRESSCRLEARQRCSRVEAMRFRLFPGTETVCSPSLCEPRRVAQ